MDYHTAIVHHGDGFYSVEPNLTVLPHYHEDTVIYRQPGLIDYPPIHYVEGFPEDEFVHLHHMTPVLPITHTDTVAPVLPITHTDTVAPVLPITHTDTVAPVLPITHTDTVVRQTYYSKEYPYFKSDTELDEQQRKSCRCYLHSEEKNTCGADEWRSGNKKKGCYNPYAVCNRNLPAVRTCSDNYDFEDFTDSELRGYIRAHRVSSRSMEREDMLDAILSKYKKF